MARVYVCTVGDYEDRVTAVFSDESVALRVAERFVWNVHEQELDAIDPDALPDGKPFLIEAAVYPIGWYQPDPYVSELDELTPTTEWVEREDARWGVYRGVSRRSDMVVLAERVVWCASSSDAHALACHRQREMLKRIHAAFERREVP